MSTFKWQSTQRQEGKATVTDVFVCKHREKLKIRITYENNYCWNHWAGLRYSPEVSFENLRFMMPPRLGVCGWSIDAEDKSG